MFSLRNRFGIPGVISVIALVFAMFGGAYAASNSGGGEQLADASKRAKKKKKAKRGPRGPRGAKGAKGEAGPAGPAGPQGVPGAKGADGAPGAKGDVGATGAMGVTGAKGATGTDGTFSTEPLPSGETLTGVWVGSAGSAGVPVGPQISFPIALGGELTASHFVAPAATPPAECPGSLSEPKAATGHLCVYAEETSGVVTSPPALYGTIVPIGGTTKYGAYVSFFSSGVASVKGTWAVTGP